jgi:hypothetical protein
VAGPRGARPAPPPPLPPLPPPVPAGDAAVAAVPFPEPFPEPVPDPLLPPPLLPLSGDDAASGVAVPAGDAASVRETCIVGPSMPTPVRCGGPEVDEVEGDDGVSRPFVSRPAASVSSDGGLAGERSPDGSPATALTSP